jgi:hypothetical protein
MFFLAISIDSSFNDTATINTLTFFDALEQGEGMQLLEGGGSTMARGRVGIGWRGTRI